LPATPPNRLSCHHHYIRRRQADIAQAAVVQLRQLVAFMVNLQIATDASSKEANRRDGQQRRQLKAPE